MAKDKDNEVVETQPTQRKVTYQLGEDDAKMLIGKIFEPHDVANVYNDRRVLDLMNLCFNEGVKLQNTALSTLTPT